MPSTYVRLASRASVAMLGSTAAALSAAEHSGSDSGLIRSFRFWKGMLPIYAHYKYVEYRVSEFDDPVAVSQAFAPLHTVR